MKPEEQDYIKSEISKENRERNGRPVSRVTGIVTVIIATVGSILAVTAIVICILIFLYVRGMGSDNHMQEQQVAVEEPAMGEKMEEAGEGTQNKTPAADLEEENAMPVNPAMEPVDTEVSVDIEEQLKELLEEEAALSFAEGMEQGRSEEREEMLSVIKEHFSKSDPSTGELLRKLYPDDTIVYKDKKYLFIPVDKGLPQNELSDDAFVQNSDGTLDYSAENRKKPAKGIDVSAYQKDIDWNAVAASGVEFAILRLGIRGYTVGGITLDEKFVENIKGATEAGLHVGVYFFSQAKDRAEILEEIEFIFANLAGYKIDGPVAIDVEEVASGQGRTGALSQAERTELVKYFCDEVESRGYLPMIYGNLNSMMIMLDVTKLGKYEKWYAYYSFPIYFKYEYSILQYGDKGKIPGISTNVDMNLAFNTWW